MTEKDAGKLAVAVMAKLLDHIKWDDRMKDFLVDGTGLKILEEALLDASKNVSR